MKAEGKPAGNRNRATHADIARETGFSRATVSYVLNDVPNKSISAATREAVLEAARRLRHVPYAPARALRLGRSDLVVALVPGYAMGLVFETMLESLDEALAAEGYGLMVHRHDERRLPLTQLWGIVSPELVVVISGLLPEELAVIEASHARMVDVGGLISNQLVGRMQAEYLVERGHQALGFAYPSHPALEVYARDRLEGVRAVCRERGIPQPSVKTVALNPTSSLRAIEEWLGEGVVTAICAHNDDIGLVLLAELARAAGSRKLAIVGADNIPMAELGLTTVGIDVNETANSLVAVVIATLRGEPRPQTPQARLTMVVRASA